MRISRRRRARRHTHLTTVLLFATTLAMALASCDATVRESVTLRALGVPMPIDFTALPCAEEWMHRQPDQRFDDRGYCRMEQPRTTVFVDWRSGRPIGGERWLTMDDSAQWARARDSVTTAMRPIGTLENCAPGMKADDLVAYDQLWTARSEAKWVEVRAWWSSGAVVGTRSGQGNVWIVVHAFTRPACTVIPQPD